MGVQLPLYLLQSTEYDWPTCKCLIKPGLPGLPGRYPHRRPDRLCIAVYHFGFQLTVVKSMGSGPLLHYDTVLTHLLANVVRSTRARSHRIFSWARLQIHNVIPGIFFLSFESGYLVYLSHLSPLLTATAGATSLVVVSMHPAYHGQAKIYFHSAASVVKQTNNPRFPYLHRFQ